MWYKALSKRDIPVQSVNMAKLVHCLFLASVVTLAEGQDLSGSELTQLYNTPVTSAQMFKRPLGSSGSVSGVFGLSAVIPHAGVVVTTTDGGRWLIHKGSGYGKASETVVTHAYHMSSAWTPGEEKSISSSKVADYVKAGGTDYSLLNDNCLHAAHRMMQLN